MTKSSFKPESLSFLMFLGATSAMTALATDMGLPAFDAMEKALGREPGTAVMTLSLFFIGYCATPLICGPLSDRFGRKPLLLLGLAIFILSVFGVAASNSMDQIFVLRTIQGMGAGFCVTLPPAIIQDLFTGDTARSYQGQVNAALGFAPLIAPVLGSLVMRFAHWRFIYVVQGVFALVLLVVTLLRFKESLAPERRQSLKPGPVARNYLTLCLNPLYLTATLMCTASFGVLFSYVSSSSMVFMQYFQLDGTLYSLIFATTAACFIGGSYSAARLSKMGVPAIRLLTAGTILVVVATGISFALAAAGAIFLVFLWAGGALGNFCYGLIGPNSVYEALQANPEIRGSASGLLRFLQMLMGSIASFLVALFAEGQPSRAPVVMPGCMFFFALLCLAGYVLWQKVRHKKA